MATLSGSTRQAAHSVGVASQQASTSMRETYSAKRVKVEIGSPRTPEGDLAASKASAKGAAGNGGKGDAAQASSS